jgi:carboxylesterase type B
MRESDWSSDVCFPIWAYHGSDLAYWFNDLKPSGPPLTEDDKRVADRVSSYWVNFVKNGNPNGENLADWAPFCADNPVIMALGLQPGPRRIAEKERFAFYHDVLEK